MVAVAIRWVTVDVADLDRAVAFWSTLLNVAVVDRRDPYAWLARPYPEAVGLALQQVPEPKVGKARAHLDLAADDFDAARRRALDLGASEVGFVAEADFTLLVMADPDGNEFCLSHTPSAASRAAWG